MEWSWCSSTSSSTTTSCAINTIPIIAFPIIFTSAPSTRYTLRRLHSTSSQILSYPLTEPVCPRFRVRSKVTESELESNSSNSSEVDCIGTGLNVECVVSPTDDLPGGGKEELMGPTSSLFEVVRAAWEFGLLISPFFFWGTAMVAMKEVLPKTGPFFVSSFRLIPSGFLLIAFAAFRGRGFPSGFRAWLSISAFALVDASCFQVPAISFDTNNFSLWGSGEWWMLLAAQSMAIGTVMVRWVSKYSDPIMATGWHMVIGGLPLLAISIINHDPVFGCYDKLTNGDILALLYTSIFGSAISYGVYFYNATRGSLTKLSSLTFLTPMFASVFGFLYLDETFTPVQLVGAFITVAAIYMVNFKTVGEAE